MGMVRKRFKILPAGANIINNKRLNPMLDQGKKKKKTAVINKLIKSALGNLKDIVDVSDKLNINLTDIIKSSAKLDALLKFTYPANADEIIKLFTSLKKFTFEESMKKQGTKLIKKIGVIESGILSIADEESNKQKPIIEELLKGNGRNFLSYRNTPIMQQKQKSLMPNGKGNQDFFYKQEMTNVPYIQEYKANQNAQEELNTPEIQNVQNNPNMPNIQNAGTQNLPNIHNNMLYIQSQQNMQKMQTMQSIQNMLRMPNRQNLENRQFEILDSQEQGYSQLTFRYFEYYMA